MKYILKTEVNENGNKVFSKERQGKDFIYLAKSENGDIGKVDKNWILQHQKEIVNLGISKDSIYPIEIKADKKPVKKVSLVAQAVDIIKGYYNVLKEYDMTCNFYDTELEDIECDTGYEYITLSFGMDACNLEEVNKRIENIIYDGDDFYDSAITSCKAVEDTGDLFKVLKQVEAAEKCRDEVRKAYNDTIPYYNKWLELCEEHDLESDELADKVTDKYTDIKALVYGK